MSSLARRISNTLYFDNKNTSPANHSPFPNLYSLSEAQSLIAFTGKSWNTVVPWASKRSGGKHLVRKWKILASSFSLPWKTYTCHVIRFSFPLAIYMFEGKGCVWFDGVSERYRVLIPPHSISYYSFTKGVCFTECLFFFSPKRRFSTFFWQYLASHIL